MASSVDDWTVLGSDEASTVGRHMCIEALEAKLAALNAGMGSDADDETDGQEGSEDLESSINNLKESIDQLQQQDAAGTDSASSATLQKQEYLQQLNESNALMQRALAEGDENALAQICDSNTNDTADALAASIARRKALEDSASKVSMKANMKADEMAAQLSARRKGVDLCFLLDCTGSMDSHIKEMLGQVDAIFQAATTVHSEALIQVAMVGYRDLCDAKRFEIFDFVDSSQAEEFREFLAAIEAEGGDVLSASEHAKELLNFADASHAAAFEALLLENEARRQHCRKPRRDLCEDVLGGLQEVTKLSWCSSTKLLIHIADYPCHGTNYHKNSIPDALPGGDPSGEKPEEYVRWLCGRGIDYNFGEIKESTRLMTEIFEGVYDGSQAHFNVLSARDPAKDFVPLVLKSVSSSMGRSPFMRMGRSPFMRRPAFGTAAPISWARKLPSHTQSAESS